MATESNASRSLRKEYDLLTKLAQAAYRRRQFGRIVLSLAMLTLVVWLALGFFFGIAYISDSVVEDTNVISHSVVLFQRNPEQVAVGDTVLYRIGNQYLTGQVAATGGSVVVESSGQLSVDGVTIGSSSDGLVYPYTVSDNCVFLIWNGADSRSIGAVPLDVLIGKVEVSWTL